MSSNNTIESEELEAVVEHAEAEVLRERHWLGLLLKVAVTAALIALVLWRLDDGTILTKVGALDPAWTFAAFIAVFAAIAISAFKWGLILKWRGHPLGYVRLVRHYFVGLFFNNVLPTTVGGDAVRAWETTKDTGEFPEAVGSVVSERLIAGVALGITALLGLPFVELTPQLIWLVIGFMVVDVALVALFLVPKVAEGVVSKSLPSGLSRLKEGIKQTVVVVRETLSKPKLFIQVTLLSILFQVLVAVVNACIFKAIGADVSLAECIIYTPMIFTITMLPISLSGLGVREAAYWYFFAKVGVSQADAVVTSLCFFVIVGIASLPGAPLFAFGRRQKKTELASGDRGDKRIIDVAG